MFFCPECPECPKRPDRDGAPLEVATKNGGVGGKLRFRGFTIMNADENDWTIQAVEYAARNDWKDWIGTDGTAHATANGYVEQVAATPSSISGVSPGASGTETIPAAVEVRPTMVTFNVTWERAGATDTTSYWIECEHWFWRLDFFQFVHLSIKKDGSMAIHEVAPGSGVKGAYRNELQTPTHANNDFAKNCDPTTILGGN